MGLGATISYINNFGIENIETYNTYIGNHLRSKIKDTSDIALMDKGMYLSNIITLYHPKWEIAKLMAILDANNVYYSIARKSMAFLDFAQKGVDWALRLSPHYFNTIEEMDEIANILSKIK